MASKRLLRLSTQEAIVKFDGAIGTTTIDLAVDLKLASESISGTPTVNIIGFQVTGAPTGVITISRGGIDLFTVLTDNSPCIDLLEFGGTAENTNNTSNIVITSSVAVGQVILKLRKVSGYVSNIQPAEFSVYDNPNSPTA